MSAEQILEDVRAALSEAGAKGDEPADAVRALATELAQLRTAAEEAKAESAELAQQAADGRQYRADLVAAALAEGVRAYGERFDSETYRATLEHAPLATIQRMRDDWQSIGDGRFAGGRQTDDGDEQGEAEQVHELHAPASMYV